MSAYIQHILLSCQVTLEHTNLPPSHYGPSFILTTFKNVHTSTLRSRQQHRSTELAAPLQRGEAKG